MASRWSASEPRQSRWSSAREQQDAHARKDDGTRGVTSPAGRGSAARSEPMIGALDRPRSSSRASSPETPETTRRRLSDEDRDAIRRWRSPRPDDADGLTDGAGGLTGAGAAALPDLPDIFEDDAATGGRTRRGGIGNRALILGGLLFLGMAVLILPAMAFPGFGIGGDPTATPAQLPTPTTTAGQLALAGTVPAASRPAAAADGRGVVCLDAGHGGWDMGFERPATGRAPRLDEAAINLGMAWMLKDRLEREGFEVVMTREGGGAVNAFNEDVNGDGQTLQVGPNGGVTDASEQAADRDELQARINICNAAEADILISLHINGFGDASVRGYEVLYTHERPFSSQSFDLATFIDRELRAHFTETGFQTEGRGVKRDTDLDANQHGYGSEPHLIMTGPAVDRSIGRITPSAMPGVVIEPLFISNDNDAAFLATAENQRVIVDAYTEAVQQYFEKYPA